jgi:uncharacterized repeat protein (TIGR03803 family)
MQLRQLVSVGFVLTVCACSTLAPKATGTAALPAAPRLKQAATGGSFTTLYSFQGQPDGADPQGSLGIYYSCARVCNEAIVGNTSAGGTNNAGTIYSLNGEATSGEFTEQVRLSYAPSETGTGPIGPVIKRSYSDPLLGVASQGGTNDKGTVVELPSAKGTSAVLSFDGRDGAFPAGGLIWDGKNTYLADTFAGGRHDRGAMVAIAAVNKKLKATVLYSFSGMGDGEHPNSGFYHLDRGGSPYYGTTAGSKSVPASVYAFVPGNGLTTLYTFKRSKDAGTPDGITAIGGSSTKVLLAGTTIEGGSSGLGTLYELKPRGSSYRQITLHTFAGGSADGAYPRGPLIHVGEHAGVYGVTTSGGSGGCGTIFWYDPSSSEYAVVYSFTCGADGAYPEGPLTADPYPNLLYGTTSAGGTANAGVVFSFVPP